MGAGAEVSQDFREDARGEGEEEESAGEEAGHFFGGVHPHDDGEAGEAVLQDGDGGDAEEGAVDGAGAAENAGAAEDDGGDGKEFVAGAGVGFGLTEPRRVDDRGDRGDETGEHVDEREAAFDGEPGVSGALGGEPDGAEGPAKGGAMDQQPHGERHDEEDPRLRREPEPALLADEEEGLGETGVGDGAAGDGLGESAEKRIGAKGDNQRREAERGDEGGVEAAGKGAEREGQAGGDRDGQAAVVPELAEENRAEAEEGADGQVDAGGDDHGGERESEEADFAGVPEDVELPVHRAEADDDAASVGGGAGEIEEQPLGDEHVEQQHLVAREQGFPVAFCGVHRWPPFRLRRPSATTARRIIAPWMAFSQ